MFNIIIVIVKLIKAIALLTCFGTIKDDLMLKNKILNNYASNNKVHQFLWVPSFSNASSGEGVIVKEL